MENLITITANMSAKLNYAFVQNYVPVFRNILLKNNTGETIEDFKEGKVHVFKGNYTGVDPDDPSDTYDLSKEFKENAKSSAPTFHYVLKDVITVVE